MAGVTYRKIDDAGLHITVGELDMTLPVDNVVICAGQEPQRELQAQLLAAGLPVHLIGGADKAEELDAKRAIKQGLELAVALAAAPKAADAPAIANPVTPAADNTAKKGATSFETLTVSLTDHIATIRLNRPDKANAMNLAMWHEIRQAFKWVDATAGRRRQALYLGH